MNTNAARMQPERIEAPRKRLRTFPDCSSIFLPTSIMESPAKLHVEFAWVIVVEAAERQAIVEQHAAVRHVQCSERNRVTLAEALSKRDVESRVSWQIVAGIELVWRSIRETGAIVDVGRGKSLPGKSHLETYSQGIPLIMIERRISGGRLARGARRRIANQSTGDCAASLGKLI